MSQLIFVSNCKLLHFGRDKFTSSKWMAGRSLAINCLRHAAIVLILQFGLAVSVCLASDAIPYLRLSQESVLPSPVGTYPKPVRKSLAWAVRRVSDVRRCLTAEEAAKPQPDIRMFDWDKIGSDADAIVCIFRIVTSLADIERTRKWFESQGFGVFVSYDERSFGVPVLLEAGWAARPFDRSIKFPTSGFTQWISRYVVWGQTISIRQKLNGDIIKISCVLTRIIQQG